MRYVRILTVLAACLAVLTISVAPSFADHAPGHGRGRPYPPGPPPGVGCVPENPPPNTPVRCRASGFAPNSEGVAQVLGAGGEVILTFPFTADRNGVATITFTGPDDPGVYTVTFSGVAPDGTPLTLSDTITVLPAPGDDDDDGGGLPTTGAFITNGAVIAAAAVLFGFLLVMVARRRRMTSRRTA